MTKRACPRKAARSWVSVSGIARNGVTEAFTLYKRGRHREWGLGGLSVEQGIADRAQCEQAHVGIKTGVGEEGRQGAE